ncbi:trypsin-like peptidase domain-containing protein [Streptomyces sp. S.PB5]|uniref:S1C family serine protease n=1 Tax=Streptomyces sp. S.PB5 TaxID=3020844 RepID=UPI0025AEF942|nr:trypsin-like peptidase domain-containing protein [Streptomyces sp. S.PB5]MDN3028982.1 trypsin-like peptidase domain-containing protein [Streptomyces sp. S.PB5]
MGALVLAASGGAALALALDDDGGKATVPAAPSPSGARSTPTQPLAKAAAAIRPSVVSITVATSSGTEVGSGLIVAADGTIMTSNHVVEDAAEQGGTISVTFDNDRTRMARFLGGSVAADIAVVKTDGVFGVRPAALGSADSLHVGDAVVAVGSPLGLRGSVSTGVVSALHRDIDMSGDKSPEELPGQDESAQPGLSLKDAIQTDAAINPGNSGGPLADSQGRVVGIATAIATTGGGYIGQQPGSIGIGFATPIDNAFHIAQGLMNE